MARSTGLLALASAHQGEEPESPKVAATRPAKKSDTRKHIGGYFDPETAKRLAMLKAETGQTTQDLLERALELLFTEAKTRASFKG